jgi:hypothetical protein
MKKTITLFLLFTACYTTLAQVTAIPDAAFEQALINEGVDSDGVINGQLLTADALAVTSLSITSPDGPSQFISNLAGLEAFTNLESLSVHFTMCETLNVSTLVHLKHLECSDNMLTALDVSNNPELEYLEMSSGGDVLPFNAFTEIDLSHNPNIGELVAWGGLSHIDLRNGNNNPNMHINIAIVPWEGMEPNTMYTTCIEVDDANAAQNNQLPYADWTILHSSTIQTYALVESCLAATENMNGKLAFLYPNPTSGILHVDAPDGSVIDKAELFDISGRAVREYNTVTPAGISVAGLQKGMYVIKIVSGKTIQTEKIVIE